MISACFSAQKIATSMNKTTNPRFPVPSQHAYVRTAFSGSPRLLYLQVGNLDKHSKMVSEKAIIEGSNASRTSPCDASRYFASADGADWPDGFDLDSWKSSRLWLRTHRKERYHAVISHLILSSSIDGSCTTYNWTEEETINASIVPSTYIQFPSTSHAA